LRRRRSCSRSRAGRVPALVFVIVALAAVVRYAPSRAEGRRDLLDERIDAGHARVRPHALWSLGVLALYGGSLFILEVPQWLGGADLTTEFQRGHTAVSAFWGVVGLVLLYLGLRRTCPSLRLAGFALLGVSLAKILLYDSPRSAP
jgi:Predicted membrane protein (DUF2339)